nr:MAG TPA: hypothetical protein [Caudoviricetes sp.]
MLEKRAFLQDFRGFLLYFAITRGKRSRADRFI